ncbi:hypothetical protein Tco_1059772 [Tanacetum coccineum]
MLTARKRVGSLPTHRLASRYPSDSSSLDQFTSDDSSRDSLSDPSSETSSDSYSDTSLDSSLRQSSSGYAISETPCDSSTATSERPSYKRCWSPSLSIPVSSPVCRALSLVRANLSPPPKRNRDSDSMTGLEISSEDGYEPAKEMDDRDVVETAATKEVESSARGMIEVEVDLRVGPVVDYDVHEYVREDVPDYVTANGAVEVIESVQRFKGHRIAGVDLEVTTMTERIDALEQDNMRLRGMLDVESQRVDRLQRDLSRAQRESMLTATHTKITQDAINELIAKRMDEALKAYDAARNPKTKAEIKNEQQDDHVEGDVNNGNGNENGNGNPNVNNEGVVPVARECT